MHSVSFFFFSFFFVLALARNSLVEQTVPVKFSFVQDQV